MNFLKQNTLAYILSLFIIALVTVFSLLNDSLTTFAQDDPQSGNQTELTIEGLNKTIEDLNATVSTLNDELTRLSDEMGTLSEEKRQLEQQVKDLDTQIALLEQSGANKFDVWSTLANKISTYILIGILISVLFVYRQNISKILESLAKRADNSEIEIQGLKIGKPLIGNALEDREVFENGIEGFRNRRWGSRRRRIEIYC